MDPVLRQNLDNLMANDGQARQDALAYVMAATDQPVDWTYEVWDDLVRQTQHPELHHRAVATTLLCNLAKSDPQRRILTDLDAVMAVTRDKSFVTARHTIQALWKIGAAGQPQRQAIVERMAGRFADCAPEKNYTLIRYDLLVGMRKLYDAAPDEALRARALALIDTEPDAKYRKKYLTVWKK